MLFEIFMFFFKFNFYVIITMYKMYSYFVFPIIFLFIGSPLKGGFTGVPFSRNEEVEQSFGLYNSSDKVISLNKDNIKLFIANQKYGTLLEFYNSFCGHCRRFAPKYKELAEEVYSWRKLIKISAIDCADDVNNDVCREYEVMAYPSLRYFPPYYLKGDDPSNIGQAVQTQKIDEIKQTLIKKSMNESHNDYWPDFTNLLDKKVENLISNLPEKVKYILVVYENENSTLASNLILDFSLYESIQIRRTTNPDVAIALNILSPTTIALIDRSIILKHIHSIDVTETSFKNVIIQFLKESNLHTQATTQENMIDTHQDLNSNKNNSKITEYVKKHGLHIVYKADLDHALHYAMLHEIPKYINISGERLLALQRFINVISHFNPLGKNGEEFIKKIQNYISSNNQHINGSDLEKYLKKIEQESLMPLFTSSNLWIGCLGSKPTHRGFTCGLWKLFHFLTVQAAESEQNFDPLEVLQAVHDYIKYFFGCSDCSKHFQEMAVRRKIWNTASKDDAVLWLWSAHNEVNQRLAGDETEDPEFPKQQFPLPSSCNECYNRNSSTSSELDQINWNKQEVLHFLKQIYSVQNISFYGLNIERLENIKKSQMIGNVFSDIDISFGFILYGFCIIMMIFAVKLFIFRGYRRKNHICTIKGKV